MDQQRIPYPIRHGLSDEKDPLFCIIDNGSNQQPDQIHFYGTMDAFFDIVHDVFGGKRDDETTGEIMRFIHKYPKSTTGIQAKRRMKDVWVRIGFNEDPHTLNRDDELQGTIDFDDDRPKFDIYVAAEIPELPFNWREDCQNAEISYLHDNGHIIAFWQIRRQPAVRFYGVPSANREQATLKLNAFMDWLSQTVYEHHELLEDEQPYFLDEDDIAEPTSPADSEYVTGSSKDSDYVPLYMTSSSSRSSTSSSAQSRRSNFSIELAGVRILDIDPHDEPEETRKDLTAVKCAIRATARLDRWRLYSKKHSAYDIYYCWTCSSYKLNSFDPERSQFTVPQLKNGVHYHEHRPACQGFPLRIVETYQHLPRIQWWVERLMTSYHAMPYHPDTLYVMSRQQAENSLRTLFPGRGSGISYVILKKGELPDEIIIIYVGITFETMKKRQRDHMNQHLFNDCQQLGFVPVLQNASEEAVRHFEFGVCYSKNMIDCTVAHSPETCPTANALGRPVTLALRNLEYPKIGSGQTLYNFNATDARRWMGSAFFETMQSIQNWLIGPSRWITNSRYRP
uniref:GIY-YIG homing endonuclease n=1 Tax=Ditylenchus dipsaci TaxID=166011 RepID=A0A915EMV3_9BILA